jgi:hypothetical protein
MTSVGFHSRNSAFKVPLPRKQKQEQNKASCVPNKSENSAGVDSIQYDASFLHIVQKLHTDPSLLTDIEMMMIRKHPVIGQVIEQAAKFNVSISNFYVPVESILKPYASNKVQIYFRPQIQIVIDEPQKTQEDYDSNGNDVSTTLSHESETMTEIQPEEIKVGFYTKKERIEKIKKYKAKKQKALDNLANRKVKYANKSAAAKKRLRVHGKFVKG